jgi:hypothetical protein
METKINIAKILKNKPEGTKLWTMRKRRSGAR